MQESDCKRVLKRAVQDEHRGAEESARFTSAIGCAVIALGLQRIPGQEGFKLMPVTRTSVGKTIIPEKMNSSVAKSSVASVIQKLQLHQYFSLVAVTDGDEHLTMHTAKVLPYASPIVKSLLPSVWPSLEQQARVAVGNDKAEQSCGPLFTASQSWSCLHEPKAIVQQGLANQPIGLENLSAIQQNTDNDGGDALLNSSAAVSLFLQAAA